MKIIKIALLVFQLSFVCVPAQNKGEIVNIRDDLKILKISDNAYIHISDLVLKNDSKVPCNGLICVNNDECIIVDTPVNDEQSKSLIDYASNDLNLNIKGVIVCHWHVDCMGGINEFHKNNIPSYSYKLTREIAETKGLPLPQNVFPDSLKIKFGSEEAIARFLGEGHARDNIVVWFPAKKILFGGCLIKDIKATTLGNLSDANTDEWDKTVQRVKESFPGAAIVIPGHGAYGGLELSDHTIELVKNYKKQN